MNRKNTPRIVLTFLLALAMAVPFLTMSRKVAAEGFFGAIQTSKGDGTTVNQNLYDSKEDVYLNGGPQNANSAGLPPGDYYFQVTNPNGSTLLSTDNASCRQVTVDSSGRIAGAAAAAGLCAHPNGTANAANGSLPVQLAPFNDTDNNGGEYKAWLIRKTVNTSISEADPKVIIFDERDAKTDNFKVKIEDPCTDCDPPENTVLSGTKFYDANVNGLNDAEAPVADVRVDVHWFFLDGDGNVTDSGDIHTATDLSGFWTAEVPNGAFYKVCEQLPFTCSSDAVGSYWAQTAPAADSNGERCYSGVAGDQAVENLDFGNVCFDPPCGGRTLGFWSNK